MPDKQAFVVQPLGCPAAIIRIADCGWSAVADGDKSRFVANSAMCKMLYPPALGMRPRMRVRGYALTRWTIFVLDVASLTSPFDINR
jgi:hypothetical protein